jgi:tetratricopeptide (TPR) repeat protein
VDVTNKLRLVVLDLDTFTGSEYFMQATQSGVSFGKGLRVYLDANYAQAVEEFRLALIAAYVEGDGQKAVRPRERAIIYLYIGNSLAFQEDWPAALGEYLNAVQTDPTLAEAHYNIGVSFAAQGKVEEAENAFRESLRYNPDLYEAKFALGRCYQTTNSFGMAYVYYTAARDCRPDAAEPLYHLGLMHQTHGAHDLAQQCFSEALRVEPSFQMEEGEPESFQVHSEQEAIEWYLRLSSDLKAQGHPEEAERVYDTLLKWRPNQSKARYLLANLLARRKQWKQALAQYRQIPAGSAEYVPACIRMSYIFNLLKKYHLSYKILYECAKNAPESSIVFLELGKTLMILDKLPQAQRCLGQAIRLDGKNVQAYFFLGRLYMAMDHENRGLKAWRKALSLSPELVSLQYDMGVICLKRGRYREAIQALRVVVKKWPEDVETRYLLGLALKESGDPVQAISHLEWVIQHNPQHVQALYFLGACHLQVGNSKTGMAYLQDYDRLLQKTAH